MSEPLRPPSAVETEPKGGLVVTRSEEELRVATVWRPYERVRIVKYLVTEERTLTVPVRREEVRVERLAVADTEAEAVPGPEAHPEPLEIVLREEEVVVEKRVVPRERVRVLKEVVSGERRIVAEVRRERVDLQLEGTAAADGES